MVNFGVTKQRNFLASLSSYQQTTLLRVPLRASSDPEILPPLELGVFYVQKRRNRKLHARQCHCPPCMGKIIQMQLCVLCEQSHADTLRSPLHLVHPAHGEHMLFDIFGEAVCPVCRARWRRVRNQPALVLQSDRPGGRLL